MKYPVRNQHSAVVISSHNMYEAIHEKPGMTE